MTNGQSIRYVAGIVVMLIGTFFVNGCQSHESKAAETAAAPARPTIRIKAGLENPYTDPEGHVWLADTGFDGGEIVTRDGNPKITNTKDSGLYQSEHYGMAGFSYAVPNGKYTVKLHFAETYDQITEPGQRLFSFNVQGKDFKNFDVFAKAGGALKAYVETVPVEVKDGKLQITFTSDVDNPEINGIEIIPA